MQIDQEEAKKIGNQLHIIRITRRLTRKSLASDIGITDKSIRWIERGQMKSRTSNLMKLVEHYNGMRDELDEDSIMRLNVICKAIDMEPI